MNNVSKIFLIIMALSINFLKINAQKSELKLNGDYMFVFDSLKNQHVLQGLIDDKTLLSYDEMNWYGEGKKSFTPDSNALKVISKKLPNYQIYAIIGTWCSDSKELFPKFIKTLEVSKYPMDKLTIFGVNGNKKALNVEDQIFDIEKVPTIIFYENNIEKGRIIESIDKPIDIWLQDFLEYQEN